MALDLPIHVYQYNSNISYPKAEPPVQLQYFIPWNNSHCEHSTITIQQETSFLLNHKYK